MAIREILQYPDPVLKKRAAKITLVDEEVLNIIRDMWETTEASPGVALAAPQIGISRRIIVCDVSTKVKKNRHHGRIALINPVVEHKEGKKVFREGCLSVPDYTGNVTRFNKVEVSGLDIKGKLVRLTAEGFEALALQHEVDHLNGLLFLDRITSIGTDLFRRKTF